MSLKNHQCHGMQKYLKRAERAEARVKELEADYQRIIGEALRCDPIPAKNRLDDQLEPPWDVIARLRARVKELEEERRQVGVWVELAARALRGEEEKK